MRLRSSKQGTSVDGSEKRPKFAAPLAAAALFAIVASIASCGGTKRVGTVKPSEKGQAFVRAEDLPAAPSPGFVRIDELAAAPPVAVRPLKPKELTPELIRRADSLLRNKGKLGTQVLVEVGDKAYIARFEWHYEYDKESERQERWHKGITLYTTE